jgi:EAL domain-containing protein (putative c-di-GMP-specific phosphodiesterase class I)
MLDALLAALKDSGLEPKRLVLDITEDAFALGDEEMLERLTTTREMGIRLAIDDFGAECSSLSRLARQPADIIKMAKVFADSLEGSSGNSVLARAMMGLARTLGAQVVVEGVERPGQLEKLTSLGCDMWQGWYFSAALESAEILRLLRNGAA